MAAICNLRETMEEDVYLILTTASMTLALCDFAATERHASFFIVKRNSEKASKIGNFRVGLGGAMGTVSGSHSFF